jgi:hypothetical protein
MGKLGQTEARIALAQPLAEIPGWLCAYPLSLENDGRILVYRGGDGTGRGKREVADVLRALVEQGVVFEGVETRESSLEDIFVDLLGKGARPAMNVRSAIAIFSNELSRFFRTVFGSILSPVLTTSLYFIVFGAAIGGRIPEIGGVPYGAFIVPGLLMLTLLGETTSNSSFGIYMPRFTGAIYELLSAPCRRARDAGRLRRRRGAEVADHRRDHPRHATLFVDYTILHPFYALGYVVLVASAFALFGFILGFGPTGSRSCRSCRC